MRILAGQYKGRSIKTIATAAYRPTQSRIRKSLFDIFGPLMQLSFADLFAGSGIIGFEAVSRGAAQVTIVENQYFAVQLLKENVQLFDNDQLELLPVDVFKFLRNCNRFDIIFADPPYQYPDIDTLVNLALSKLTKNGRFVLESEKNAILPSGAKHRFYGDTQLSFWTV